MQEAFPTLTSLEVSAETTMRSIGNDFVVNGLVLATCATWIGIALTRNVAETTDSHDDFYGAISTVQSDKSYIPM